MAVFKLTDKPRNKPWCADVHRKGHKRMRKMFASKRDAKRWFREEDGAIDTAGLPLTSEELRKKTVADIVDRYLKERTPKKGSVHSEKIVLKRFLRHPIANLSLAAVSGQQKYGYQYRDERLNTEWKGKPITTRTVWREITVIRRVFNVARKEWGYTNLRNPFQEIDYDKPVLRVRTRRLEGDELDRLLKACEECRGLNRHLVPMAIWFAIGTAMRLQEIFNLKWGDVDFDNRRIVITKSKTDYKSEYEGRTIVMTAMAMLSLEATRDYLIRQQGSVKLDATVFPITKEAFKRIWADVVKRANINPKGEERKRLTFHDLRREAGSQFDEAGLTKGEHDLMMGHSNKDMHGTYVSSSMRSIQDKLDRHFYGGKTHEEVMAIGKALWEARNKDGSNVVPLRPSWRSALA